MRIIPARAGFTCPPPCRPSRASDHPRSRGVYRTGGRLPSTKPGSSPLARGLRFRSSLEVPPVRIIPARAGFTCSRRSAGRAIRDHPRSRGVYAKAPGFEARKRGSSPLARGLLHHPSMSCSPSWDHPRSRGVYQLPARLRCMSRGSSPLARGLPLSSARNNPGNRIIPARAGFTHPERPTWPGPGDHPRSRGVYL